MYTPQIYKYNNLLYAGPQISEGCSRLKDRQAITSFLPKEVHVRWVIFLSSNNLKSPL